VIDAMLRDYFNDCLLDAALRDCCNDIINQARLVEQLVYYLFALLVYFSYCSVYMCVCILGQ
jgi:hypothetical protein